MSASFVETFRIIVNQADPAKNGYWESNERYPEQQAVVVARIMATSEMAANGEFDSIYVVDEDDESIFEWHFRTPDAARH
jgi:hypothetical protein